MYISYIEKHKHDRLTLMSHFNRPCYVLLLTTGAAPSIERGTLLSVDCDAYSDAATVLLSNGTEHRTLPCLIFLSKPQRVTTRDIFGDLTSYQESAIAYRL